ncbi:MAG: hypothetical protein IPM79_16020 [Polyangiaceae bacterium]|nr:hypothetical protein [Polyangiaceae bacterium]
MGRAFSGLVLCLVAYDAKGVVGVGVFLGVTFILGKVEATTCRRGWRPSPSSCPASCSSSRW